MSTKGILTAVIAATAILTGLASYSSAIFSTKVEQQISKKNSIAGVEASIIERNNGFFARQQTYKIVLSAQYLQDSLNLPHIEQAMEFYIPHSFVVYPLYIVSDIKLDLTRGSIEQWLNDSKLNDLPHRATITTNILLQSTTFSLDVAAHQYQIDDINLSHQGLTLVSTSDLEFSAGDFNFNVSELKLAASDKGQFTLAGVKGNSRFDTIADILVVKQSAAMIKNISYNDTIKNITFVANNLVTASSLSFNDQKMSLNAEIKVASLAMTDQDNDYLVKDSILEFSLSDLSEQGYLELEQVSRQINPNPQRLTAALMKLVEAGGKGNISKLNFNINDVQFTSQADFSLPVYQGNLAKDELNQHVAQNFELTALLGLSANYAEKFAQFKPMIEHFTSSGYATVDEQGNVSSKLHYQQGKFFANDTDIGI